MCSECNEVIMDAQLSEYVREGASYAWQAGWEAFSAVEWVRARTFGDFVAQHAVALLLLWLCDRLLAPRRARWFFLHAMANMAITCLAFPDLARCFSAPLDCFRYPWTTTQAYSLGGALHLYHILAFSMNSLDWLHHGLMVFVMLPWTCYFQPYLGSNVAVWGLTGLPGGIDYILLTLVKLGHIRSLTEKRANVFIQVWFRMPFLVWIIGIYYVNYLQPDTLLTRWCIPCAVSVAWNGIFFMHHTLAAYYTKYGRTEPASKLAHLD
mmetsp:Transcript_20928/g.53006  ORF Transcript_20928/g.53006 Transcript_20928/m.53006 type:complete len:266 (-) Transcript_20928:832-1629(-)|eukprot:CAMPEP_0177684110 /NCGR_PEP_ID=MMETSP0447-20121125/32229_1 /TAXON_ID=0 /ORGANISM="Stygamoeba regulata, Strain BSH-02190019" /LENGTH=265 /DNA_ID=CAMNT_0019193881 /DNA_START=234 /DNA_END=1031 /DNA_ORIENTATION=-